MVFKNINFWIPLVGIVISQNLQVQYEMDGDRQYFVSTFEMFKPDDYGSTFWFVDFEYDAPGKNAASLAYLEIARYIDLPFTNYFQSTFQFNDGLTSTFSMGPVWLAGISKEISNPFIPLTVDVLFRRAISAISPDIQFTGVWFKPFIDGKLVFTGFIDVWSIDNSAGDGKDWVVFSEPQVWYSLSKNASIGGEVHIQYNFPVPTEPWEFFPTIGLKWDF